MVFGGVSHERLQLNEDTLWSGGPREGNNPAALALLPLVRKAVAAGEFALAGGLTKGMQGPWTESYLPFGNLNLDFSGLEKFEGYRRDLNLDGALATTVFTSRGVAHRREVLSSFPDQVVVLRCSASKPGAITCQIGLNSKMNFVTTVEGNSRLVMRGRAPSHCVPSYVGEHLQPVQYSETSGMRFQGVVEVQASGGRIVAAGSQLHVERADELLVFMSLATSFQGYDRCPVKDGADEDSLSREKLQRAVGHTWPELLLRHQADHRLLYRRSELQLPAASTADQPTDARILAYGLDQDPSLVALLYHYGRYLLIASSRPGTQAANLQGIWNDEIRPPWSSNYTTNINAQMNYWHAETTNLSELHEPLLSLITDLSVKGRATAAVNYGTQGWVTHHNTDLWRQSAPAGDYGKGEPQWGPWAMGGVWLCAHGMEHYRFTQDREFLQAFWPVMEGSALFLLDWLQPMGPHGELMTCPSSSPENTFAYKDGAGILTVAAISMGSTIDMTLVKEHLDNCLEAAKILGVSSQWLIKAEQVRVNLFKPSIAPDGRLREWDQDFVEVEPHHRHVSHLYGLYPGNQFGPNRSPELTKAASESLRVRGPDSTGWSMAWKACLNARLGNAPGTLEMLQLMLRLVKSNDTTYSEGGGAYANLFDAHPPFQIDGNFGITAAIAEMLVQSHAGEVVLLPALPKQWSDGSVRGLCVRGNFVLDLQWSLSQMRGVHILARVGGTLVLRVDPSLKLLRDGQTIADPSGRASLILGPGESCKLTLE